MMRDSVSLHILSYKLYNFVIVVVAQNILLALSLLQNLQIIVRVYSSVVIFYFIIS